MKEIVLVCLYLSITVRIIEARPHLNFIQNLRSRTDETTQQAAVRGLLARLLPSRSGEFQLFVDSSLLDRQNKDEFVIEAGDQPGQIKVTGSTGVATAWGLHYYLKRYAGAHVSWSGDQLDLPRPLVQPPTRIVVGALDRFRYYENVCTPSYSSVWWQWDRWEREIDWMALHGINMPLVIDGQEEIWYRVYTSLGLTDFDLSTFFVGPAFLGWGRMGNIDGWGGPLPASWRLWQLNLMKNVTGRMRELGMTPALSAFSGHVPGALERIYPNSSFSRLDGWSHFEEPYCCTHVLDFRDPLFAKIGKLFIEEQTRELGTDHIYSCDTFNEMTPSSNDPEYLSNSSLAVYDAMTSGDPDAIWLMQAWLFLNPFWLPTRAKALLTGVPIGRLLVLDLQAEVIPQYPRFQSFYGQPFVWCMLHNFGGKSGLYGAAARVNAGPEAGRSYPNSTMVGIGMTPESIEQNPVMYELMAEMGYRENPVGDLAGWFRDYALGRYGLKFGGDPIARTNVSDAWGLLLRSVYNCTTDLRFHGLYIFTSRPRFGLGTYIWYNPLDVRDAWKLFVSVVRANSTLLNVETFQHDLIDVTREALMLVTTEIYQNLTSAYKQRDLNAFLRAGTDLLNALLDLDAVLGTGKHFQLGTWLERAKAVATDDLEKSLYEYNARNQITLWGPKGEIVDYAAKQWNGVCRDYFWPRWNLFIKKVKTALERGRNFSQPIFNYEVFKLVEEPFTLRKDLYPDVPTGDTLARVTAVYDRWLPVLQNPTGILRYYRRFLKLRSRSNGRVGNGLSARG